MPKVHLKKGKSTSFAYCGALESLRSPYPLLADTLKDWAAVEPEDRCKRCMRSLMVEWRRTAGLIAKILIQNGKV